MIQSLSHGGKFTFDPATHLYSFEGKVVPSVTQIVSDVAGYKGFSSERAMAKGSAVHEAIAKAEAVDLSKLPPECDGYMDAWYLFLKESKTETNPEGFKIEFKELQLFSDQHCFAGTTDVVGRLGKQRCVVDMKCTEKINKKYVRLQLAAYAHLCAVNGLPVERQFCLQLRQGGTYKMHEMKDGFREFLNAKDNYLAALEAVA